MINKRVGTVLGSAWCDLKNMGALGISEINGRLQVHMMTMNGEKDCEPMETFSEDYNQIYKIIDGVKFFSLIKRSVNNEPV